MVLQHSFITVAAAPFGSPMSLPATRVRVQISVVAGMMDVMDNGRNEATWSSRSQATLPHKDTPTNIYSP